MLQFVTIIAAVCCSLMSLGSAQEVAELRLVGGPNRCEGRVEIMQDRANSQFGQACDLNAGTTEAMVACRMIHCNPEGAQRVDPVQYGFSARINRYVAFGFDCLGFEADLNVCLEPGATCRTDSAPYAVAIRCGEGEFVPNTGPTPTPRTMPPPPPSELRLLGGNDVCEGRLVIARGGSFVQGCGAEVDTEDAMVVCRQLGCNPVGAQRVGVSQFGFSSGSLRLFNRVCNGTESNIDECEALGSRCVLGTSTALAFRCGEGGLIATQSPSDESTQSPSDESTQSPSDESTQSPLESSSASRIAVGVLFRIFTAGLLGLIAQL